MKIDVVGNELRKDAPWAFIAVMGVTGAGKSTFIQTASQDETVEIGHSLVSCESSSYSRAIVC